MNPHKGTDSSSSLADAPAHSVSRSRVEELENAFMTLEAEKTRLENQARANERFFMGMANEIQNPVGQAVVMAEMLLAEPAAQSMNQEARDIARDIRETMQLVLATVNDVLDLSKIHAGGLTLNVRNYDFIDLMKGVRSAAYFQAKEKNLGFDFSVDPALPRHARGDPDRLRRILANIIGNAVKSTDRGRVAVAVGKDGDSININISDTGAGIDPENLDQLFSPFHRLSGGGAEGDQGLGLGLAVSKSLVDIMGGSILVDSVPGAGSRIHLRLPLVPGDPADVRNEHAPARRRILVVDDNDNNLRSAAAVLAGMGYACDTASSGPAALDLLSRAKESGRFDLILVDYDMPGMNGAEVARAVREGSRGAAVHDAHWRKVPIVGLAAVPDRDGPRLLESGMNGVLAKPVTEPALRRALEKWLPSPAPSQPHNPPGKGDTSIMSADILEDRLRCGVVEMAAKIEGLDVAAGLRTASGQYGMYEELLQLAAETLPGLIDNLIAAGREGDADRLRIEINGLGESLHTLGMIGLSRRAEECESLLERNGPLPCEETIAGFVRDLRLFATRLQELFENGSHSSSVLFGSAAALETRLHKLLHAMALGNHVEVRKLAAAATRRKYDAAHRMSLMEIRRLVNAGEYKAARNRINSVLQSIAG